MHEVEAATAHSGRHPESEEQVGTASDNGNPLLGPADLARFARAGVGEDLLRAAHVRRVTDAEARELYGMRFNSDLAGIVFPYLNPENGDRWTARLRRDNPEVDPEGKPQNKCVCAHGDNRHLYFPPGAAALLSDVTVPVVMVEAEKSALAALAGRHERRLLAIATGGCWGWRGKTGIGQGPKGERAEERGPLPDFGLLTLRGARFSSHSIRMWQAIRRSGRHGRLWRKRTRVGAPRFAL